MRASLFLISLALSSAACSDGAEYAEEVGVDESLATTVPSADPAQAVRLQDETERFQFAYAWPAEAASITALNAELDKRAETMRAQLQKEADDDWNAAEGQEWTPRQHSVSMEWKVVADIQRFLSLSGEMATYSGGAHGMYGVSSLVWDREAGEGMDGVALFNSPVALEQGLGQRLCDTLNAAREKRRGMAIEEDSTDTFDTCPGLDEATVLVGSSNGRTFDRITVYFGPYVAGPYAEGAYELDFDVTASVIDAVKPEYAGAFSVRG